MSSSIPTYNPAYSNGWQDYSSGNTPITASVLNNHELYHMQLAQNFIPYVAADLTPTFDGEYSQGQLIATYTENGTTKPFYIAKPTATVDVGWTPGPTSGEYYIGTLHIQDNDIEFTAPLATYTPVVTTGTVIGYLDDGTGLLHEPIYAPSGGGGSEVSYEGETFDDSLKIGTLTVDEEEYDIEIPNPVRTYPKPRGGCLPYCKFGTEQIYEIFYESPHYGAGSMLTGSQDIDISAALPTGKLIDFIFNMDNMAKYDDGKWKELNGSGEGFDTVSYFSSDGKTVHFYSGGWIQDVTVHIIATLKDA